MDSLPERWRRALSAIVEAPRAWVGLGAMRRKGFAAGLVDQLAAAELVEIWERYPRGRAVTLSPWSAERLGVVIDERLEIDRRGGAYREVQFWVGRGEESRSVMCYPDRGTCRMPFPELSPCQAARAEAEADPFVRDDEGNKVKILNVYVMKEKPRKPGQRRPRPKRAG